MRRLAIGAGAAVLGLALGASLVRADDSDTDKPPTTHWWDRIMPGKTAKPEADDDDDDKQVRTEPKAPVKAGPTARELAIAQREKEKANFMRRSDACLKLKQIALDTGDDELHRRAEELNDRAWSIYLQRTAALPSVPGVANDPPSMAGLDIPTPKQTSRKERP